MQLCYQERQRAFGTERRGAWGEVLRPTLESVATGLPQALGNILSLLMFLTFTFGADNVAGMNSVLSFVAYMKSLYKICRKEKL